MDVGLGGAPAQTRLGQALVDVAEGGGAEAEHVAWEGPDRELVAVAGEWVLRAL